MRKIEAFAKTIRSMLSNMKYDIDYYQREFKWETKHVTELIEDFSVEFLDNYEDSHSRNKVGEYGHYFLGSVIINNKDNKSFIVDGQQRLTTLTLLLIYLNNLQGNREDRVSVEEMIFSEKFGTKSFNLQVDERKKCMEALYEQEMFEEGDASESIMNIIDRYRDIEEQFPDEMKGRALPYFIDWLIENVYLVEITAYSDEDAYTIFETMNDRGLSLTPADMLKGFLLANIDTDQQRWEVHDTWRSNIIRLAEINNDDPADFFKSWLRSQYAKTIRERKKGASHGDFDRIGTEFHRWVREKKEDLGLQESDDFVRFIERDLTFYAKQYRKIRQASLKRDLVLEELYFVAQYGFTLQYPLLLAPLNREDSEEEINRKIRIVATYLDILLTRRLWNWRSISYSTLQYAMFKDMLALRGRSALVIAKLLTEKLVEEKEDFVNNEDFAMHGQNRVHIHRILARITDYVEQTSGNESKYDNFMRRSGGNRYEVEHIWANHPEWHRDEFGHSSDFLDYRNRIGGLLLLPKKANTSLGDLPYEKKLEHYLKYNLLAQSLHPVCYDRNPGFLRFISETELPFKPHATFKKADLDERQNLYLKLADLVWSPDRLEQIANG